jgi:small subunit ribosomal protein S20
MAKLKTGRHTSALKEARKNAKRRIQNTAVKHSLKTISKKIETAIQNKDLKTAKELLNEAFSKFDKAAKTNCIHKKKADRKKAQLASKLSSIEK